LDDATSRKISSRIPGNKKHYDFFTRVQTPELAAAITLQPIDIIGSDAAIIFSDILVVPQAMGMEVQMNEGKGPLLPITIRQMEDVRRLIVDEAHFNLQYVYDAIRLTKQQLKWQSAFNRFCRCSMDLILLYGGR
jgi:uroporphyrinogen decarboxylase